MEVPLTPLEFLRRARRLYPHREAVVDGEQRFSHAEFFARCDRLAGALQAFGLEKGDRVACILPNCHEYLELFHVVPRFGAIIVPVNHRLTADDFAWLLRHCRARLLFAHNDHLEAVDSVRRQLLPVEQFVAVGGWRHAWRRYEDLLAAPGAPAPLPEVGEHDVLSINYTSGTNSRPKGVMLTHRNVYVNVVGTLIHVPLQASDRYLWTLPMFHANGWGFVWAVTAMGATHVCLPKVEPAAVFAALREESITVLCAAPTVLVSLANAAPEFRGPARAGVRVLTAGAAPTAATIARIEGELGWEVIHVYGLTETSPFISICEQRPGDAGLPAADRAELKARQGVELLTSGELRVLDGDGVPVAQDGRTVGQIHVRGNTVMLGYYDDPVATAKALDGGWFRTGDAAVVHPDGYVEIRDRLKDVIISGG